MFTNQESQIPDLNTFEWALVQAGALMILPIFIVTSFGVKAISGILNLIIKRDVKPDFH